MFLQCRRPVFDPWVGKIPWRRERLPTSVFWPGEFQGLYSPWGLKELDTTEWLALSLDFEMLRDILGLFTAICHLISILRFVLINFKENQYLKLHMDMVIKSPPANAWNTDSVPELGSSPKVGNGTLLQYSCLENPMDGGAWWAAVHGVVKSRTWLSDFTFTFHFHALEKETATYSSVLAWRIPGTGEPGGLPSMGSHRVGHNWSDLAAEAATNN